MEQNNVVEEHKKMLITTGRLSDYHLKNLKTWPFLLFDKLDRVNIKYEFERPKTITNTEGVEETVEELYAGLVEYDFEFKKGFRITKEMKTELLEKLSIMVKFLFWNDTQVIIKRKGRIWT